MGLKKTTSCCGYQQVLAAGTATPFSLTVPNPSAISPTPPTYAVIQAEAQALRCALSAIRAWTISPANAYRGATFRVKREATGVSALLVNGVGVSLNSWMDMEFDGSAWVQTASGGLL